MKVFEPPFGQTNKTETAVVTGAVASITTDAPSNTVALFTAGEEGSIISNISAMPRSEISDTSLLLFLGTNEGTTKRLIDSVQIKAFAITPGAAVQKTSFPDITPDTPLRLMKGQTLWVGSLVALPAGIVVAAKGMDF